MVIDHIIKEGYFQGIQHVFQSENISTIIQNQFVGFSSSLPRNWITISPTVVQQQVNNGERGIES